MIDRVHVTGGDVPSPKLNCSSSDILSCLIVVSERIIEFSSFHCGHNMPLIKASVQELERTRVVPGSPPVTGMFDLTLRGMHIQNISADISSENLKKEMEKAFPNQGGFEVVRLGGCFGYKWQLTWSNKGGDQLPMEVSNARLVGDFPTVQLETVTDGGVWMSPIRGDMLRLPETQPQVIFNMNNWISLNKLVAYTCISGDCSVSDQVSDMFCTYLSNLV